MKIEVREDSDSLKLMLSAETMEDNQQLYSVFPNIRRPTEAYAWMNKGLMTGWISIPMKSRTESIYRKN